MKNYPVQLTFPIHWGEMDALNHVNNIRFFRWFESARMELFHRLGLLGSEPPSIGPILAYTDCQYRRPLQWPTTVIAGAGITKVGRTSFTMGFGVAEEKEPEKIVAEGVGVIVLVEYATGEKVPLSEDLKSRLTEFIPEEHGPLTSEG